MVNFSFYQYSSVQSKADLERVGKGGFYVTQDGGMFFVFADKAHEDDCEADPFCCIDTRLDPKLGDMAEAMRARKIAHNALCTYGAVTFDGE